MHAHGLTFRDNYLLLGLVVRSLRCWQKLLGLPALVCLIATATASPSTVDDILRLLDVELSTCRVMRAPSGSLRAQMTYTTLPVSSAVQRRQVVNELLRQRIGSLRHCLLLVAQRVRTPRHRAELRATCRQSGGCEVLHCGCSCIGSHTQSRLDLMGQRAGRCRILSRWDDAR